MKILITGASGFIGSNLIRYFSKKGHHVIALGRNKQPPILLKEIAEYFFADISQPIEKINCDVVVHTAALADDRSDFDILKKINVDGTKNVYEATPTAQLFIHISSASIYQYDGKIHAENKLIDFSKLSLYGQSKLLAEEYLTKRNVENKSIVILRPRAVYGIGDRVLLPRILNLQKKGKVFFPGKKEVVASLTHIDNLIHAIDLIHAKCKPGISFYNIADEEEYYLQQLVKELIYNSYEKKFNCINIPIWCLKLLLFIFKHLRLKSNFSKQSLEYLTHSNVLEIKKIKKEIGYESVTDFEREKMKLYRWIREVGIERILTCSKELPWHESINHYY